MNKEDKKQDQPAGKDSSKQKIQESGWSFPPVNLNIPMPKVKPPKSVSSSTSSSAESK